MKLITKHPPRPDFTKEPIEITVGMRYCLEGDQLLRYVDESPTFANISFHEALEFGWSNGPHEYCLLTSLEFARRNPNHPFSKAWRENPEFTDEEIMALAEGEKRIVVRCYNGKFETPLEEKVYWAKRKIITTLFGTTRPDFSLEPVLMEHTYDYWLEGDDYEGKPRGGMGIPQFANIRLEDAEANGWVSKDSGDAEYSIMCQLEFARRYPAHPMTKEACSHAQYFTPDEILDISQGRKRLVFY